MLSLPRDSAVSTAGTGRAVRSAKAGQSMAIARPKRVELGLTWTVKFRDGRELRFTYPSRSTPVGSSEPYKNFSEDPAQDLRSQTLAGESRWLGVDRLPTLSPR